MVPHGGVIRRTGDFVTNASVSSHSCFHQHAAAVFRFLSSVSAETVLLHDGHCHSATGGSFPRRCTPRNLARSCLHTCLGAILQLLDCSNSRCRSGPARALSPTSRQPKEDGHFKSWAGRAPPLHRYERFLLITRRAKPTRPKPAGSGTGTSGRVHSHRTASAEVGPVALSVLVN